MNANDARRVVLLSMIGTTGIVLASRVRKGQWPEPKQFVGTAFVYLVVGGLADFAPGVAAPGAALIFAGTAIKLGPEVFGSIGGRASGKPSIVPPGTFDLPGASSGTVLTPGNPLDPGSPVPIGGGVKGGCVNLPFNVAPRLTRVRAQFAPEVESLCRRFKVRVSSGYRTSAEQVATGSAAHNSDHLCGAACDFVGTPARMNALAQYAISSKRYAVVVWRGKFYEQSGATGPWEDHYDHVHISFARCGNAKGCK